MTLTGPDIRILQVHPTRFCNMRCAHCYSSSGPQERRRLPVPLLEAAIADAAWLGYNVLSVSGGEPMLYSGLRAICAEAHRRRMLVTLVTNGTVMDDTHLADISGVVDAIAISLDGAPERHNRMRAFPRAFQVMERRLDGLRRTGIPFGFVFTLTRDNLSELEWAAEFAVAQGASTLQVHPVEQYGRAVGSHHLDSLPEQELATGALVVECLRSIYDGKLLIHFDSLHRAALPVEPDEVARWKTALDRGNRYMGEIVSPLVIEDDGTVVPLRYGFPRAYAVGNLHQQSFSTMSRDWMRRRSGAFCDLYRKVLLRVRQSPERFVNMYQLMAEEAGKHRSLVRLQRAAFTERHSLAAVAGD